MKKTVAVIGAGIAGLTAAYELHKAGFRVTVFEANKYIGGRMSSLSADGFIFDRGADFFVLNYKSIRHYIREFGLVLKKIPGDHVVFRNKGFHRLAFHSLGDIISSRAVGIWSKLRLGLFLLRQQGSDASSYFRDVGTIAQTLNTVPESLLRGNAHALASKLISEEVADYLIDSFTRTMHFHSSKEITGGLLYLVAPMFVSDELSTLCCVSGGMQKLADAFARQLTVHVNAPVEHITQNNGDLVVTPTGKKKCCFDIVVIATPATKVRSFLDSPTKEQKAVLQQVTYAQTITVSYKILTHSLKNIQCAYIPYKENKVIAEFTNEEKKGISAGAYSLVSIGLHEEAAKKLMKQSDEHIFAVVKDEFQKLCPQVKVQNFVLMRHSEAMPKFSYRHIMRVRRFLAHDQGQNNIYFAGDWLNSPWAEGACASGATVAKMIINKHR
ncbi:FAD-dependent oxidoreductase [Candidatus Woesearchaeota archaeon]|nr:FAD-dependent oxidoreductase [Candidatus Woesearchaeota archaeon]